MGNLKIPNLGGMIFLFSLLPQAADGTLLRARFQIQEDFDRYLIDF